MGSETLNDLQQAAREGCMSETMKNYIEWLLPRYETLAGQLDARYQELLREALKRVDGAHARIPPVLAYLMLGLEMMFRFFVEKGAVKEDQEALLLEGMWEALLSNTQKQIIEMAEEKPNPVPAAGCAEPSGSLAPSGTKPTRIG